MTGTWRALGRGWPVFVPVIIAQAALQSLLITSDPVPESSWSFVALTVGSLLVVLVAVWLTTCTASAAVDGVPRQGLRRAVRRPGVLVWALAVGVVTVAASMLSLWLTPLVLLLGAFVLPAAAATERSPVVATAYRPVVQAPARTALAVLGALVLAVLSWVVALLLGFFITGVLAAFLTWLWFGAATAFVLCLWCSLHGHGRRPQPALDGSALDGAAPPA